MDPTTPIVTTNDNEFEDTVIINDKQNQSSIDNDVVIENHNLSIGEEGEDGQKIDKKKSEDNNMDCNLSDSSPSKSSDAQQQLRRSQRASAKRAQERLRGDYKEEPTTSSSCTLKKDSKLDSSNDEKNLTISEDSNEPPEKIRRLVDLTKIDPTDPHFAVQVTDDGEVVMLSDESEISSLCTNEVDFIRKGYEKLTCKELTEEQHIERDRMIQELKTQLRIEEARLALLKKMRETQRVPSFKHQSNAVRNFNASGVHASQTAPGTLHGHLAHAGNVPRPPAYRPPVAAPPQFDKTGISGNISKQSSVRLGSIDKTGGSSSVVGRPVHHSGVGNNSNHHQSNSNAVSNSINSKYSTTSNNAVSSNNQPSKSGHHYQHGVIDSQVHSVNHQSVRMSSAAAAAAGSGGANAAGDLQTPAQRQAAAKLALRKQLEKTLLQIPPPKPPPPEMNFVPNPNQPDFLYLLGLDEIVERMMINKELHILHKNKTAAAAAAATGGDDNVKENDQPPPPAKKSKPGPRYRTHFERYDRPLMCVQCGTDFTPFWKRLDRTSRKIACEQCVRSNEKKSLKAEHTNLLKQAFVKALQQEQEIERQIKDGTFNFSSLASTTSGGGGGGSTATANAHHHQQHHHHHHQSNNHVTSNKHGSHSSSGNSHQQHGGGGDGGRHVSSNHSTPTATPAAAAATSAKSSSAAVASPASANTAAAAAAALAASNLFGGLNLGHVTAGFPAAHMLGVGWNPLLAARWPAAAMAVAAAAAANAAQLPAAANFRPNNNWQNLPKDFMKNLQQLQQQQQQNVAAAVQRQFLLDMMPRPPKYK